MKSSLNTLGLLSLLLALGSQLGCSGADPSPSTGGHGSGAVLSPTGLSLTEVAYNGLGCNEVGSVSLGPGSDSSSALLTYTGLTTDRAPGAGFRHINCAAGITVRGVSDWQFKPTGVHTRGSAHLPTGAQGRARASVFSAGEPTESALETALTGPVEGPFDDSKAFTGEEATWSPCGADALVNVNTSVDLTTPPSAEEGASVEIKSVEVRITLRAC